MLFLAITIWMQSCVGLGNISSDYSFTKNEGVLVLSITASGECGIPYFGEIRNVNTGKKYSINLSTGRHGNDWFKSSNICPSDRDVFYGRLAVLAVPAGVYELYQFEGINQYKKVHLRNNLDVRFVVAEGMSNYVGNYHFHVAENKVGLLITDMSSRDLPVFKKRYEYLANGTIRVVVKSGSQTKI